jgi:hypothetical protein
VIRYNWIEAGNRRLDLVETDYAGIAGDLPDDQYVIHQQAEERPVDGSMDIGAFEYAAPKRRMPALLLKTTSNGVVRGSNSD